jgi:AcrR family transcriptional regulator
MSDTEPGLRERKRRATRFAIQQAALRIANEQSLAAVTVDEISRLADISPRTFFNYFPSKEQALLGDDPTLPEDAVAIFAAGGPTGELLHDIGAMLVHSTEELVDERELVPERHQLLRANPELFGQRMTSMKEFQNELASVIEGRVATEDPVLAADPDALRRRARLASLIAMATLRHAWWEWSESEHEDAHLVDSLTSSFGELDALVSRTLV